MTNSSLRERLGIEDENAAQASRLIRESVNSGLVRLYDPDVRRKNASYLPVLGMRMSDRIFDGNLTEGLVGGVEQRPSKPES